MECMAARALKSSFLTETSTKPTTTQQVFTDDIWCVAGFTGGSGTDDFSIDEFFDIPNEDSLKNASFTVEDEEEEEEEKYSSSSLSHHLVDDSHNFSSQLSIPADDLQELELWSHLMDDSLPQEAIFACPTPIQPKQTGFELVNRVGTGRKRSVSRVVPFIPTAVPVKPRTKRPRISSNRVWFTGSPSSSSSSASSSLPSSPVSTLVFPNLVQETRLIFSFGKPAVKKPKRKPVVVSGETGGSVVQRRCTHCQVTKTPQWRTGPNGPKSLCNACGVRFKSGRLFPEYRPACSPTFSSEVHSNSHRKVLEMRRKKEAVGSETGSDPISS